MSLLTDDELEALCTLQQVSMPDSGSVLRPTFTVDEVGQSKPTFAEESTIAFGWNPKGGEEKVGEQAVVTTRDGMIRAPLSADIRVTDRIRAVSLAGHLLAEPVDFDVVGTPRRGPTAQLVPVRKVSV